MMLTELWIDVVVMMDDPLARLERMYIEEYLSKLGYSYHMLSILPEGLRSQLMTEASRYASCRLAQVEQRAEFVRSIHTHIESR